jgi:propanediol utilization protein
MDLFTLREETTRLAREVGFPELAVTQLNAVVAEVARKLLMGRQGASCYVSRCRSKGKIGLEVVVLVKEMSEETVRKALESETQFFWREGNRVVCDRSVLDLVRVLAPAGHGAQVELIKWKS